MKQKEITVVQDETKPVPVEIIAESIRKIGEGMRRVEASGLNRRALTLLLAGSTGVALYQIEKVLTGLEQLEAEYVKPKKKGRK